MLIGYWCGWRDGNIVLDFSAITAVLVFKTDKEPFFCEKLEKNGFLSAKLRVKSRFSAKNLRKMAL